MRKLLLLLVLSYSFGACVPSHAQFIQQRFLPANGERGKTGPRHAYPLVQIDKKLLRLAPGARIYDAANRTIVHAHLPSGTEVFYSKEQSGAILRLYILSAQEIDRLQQAGKR
jgi:hypothetical protein